MKKLLLCAGLSLGISIVAQSQSWSLSGNAGTNPSVNFVGTTDNVPLKFRIGNVHAGLIDTLTKTTLLGYASGISISTGTSNTGLGYRSLSATTVGYSNIAIGVDALRKNVNGANNIAIGYQALYNQETATAFYQDMSTPTSNIAIGSQALWNTKPVSYDQGTENVGVGTSALFSNTNGTGNTAVGSFSLNASSTATYNTAVGYQGLANTTTGSFNTAVGRQALSGNRSGGYNTATGSWSSYYNNTGYYNTANGVYSLYNNTNSYNTAVGYYSMYSTTNSQCNTAIGYYAGAYNNLGHNNVLMGANCNTNASGYYNVVALGQGITISASSQARIGNYATSSIGGYVGWSNISDGRVKKNMKEDVPGLEFIAMLRPITYTLDLDAVDRIIQPAAFKTEDGKIISPSETELQARKEKQQIVYTGFVAQEVEDAAKKLGFDFSGVDAAKNSKDLYGLRYADFVVPLVKAVQEQQDIITAQQLLINKLEKKMEELEKRVSAQALLTVIN